MQHGSDPLSLLFPCQLCLECIWPAKLCLCHNHAAQSRGSGQNSGNPQFCLCNLIKCMNELLSTRDPAFVQLMALILIGSATSPVLPEQSSYFPACPLHLHRTWSCHHVPSLPLLAVRETILLVLLCCRLVSSASHRAGRTLHAACSVTNGLLLCHHVVPLHCTYSAELLYSMGNPAHHLPGLSFPHYCCFFWGWRGFLVLIAKLQQKAVTCGISSLEAKGVWGFTTWLLYCIIPANTSPCVFWILQATLHWHGFGNTWIK